ncbi:MAG: hypothetical protein FJX42_02240 [Alphaproteobacteria bacterium]|nr:hypothetical protein [Alphaproteobacteria bacterium]
MSAAAPPPANDEPLSKFRNCPSCAGSGMVTAQRSGDFRREPEKYRPDQAVMCRICGGTGLVPRPGLFGEE